MRCFDRILTDIEDDRNAYSKNVTIPRSHTRPGVPDTEARDATSPVNKAYYKYYLDNIDDKYVQPKLCAKPVITLPLIEAIVDKAARAKDPQAQLRSLRRQLAWRLHPDLRLNQEPDGLLAKANACIDRALERTKN
jgi:hypothetical protein